MKILHELSWLWETLGIELVAAAVCMACTALILSLIHISSRFNQISP